MRLAVPGILLREEAETKIILQGLATKAEVEQLRGEMRASFEKVYATFEKVNVALEKICSRVLAVETLMPHMATKADIHEVKTEIAKLHLAVIKWVIGTLISGMAAAYAFAKLVN